VGGQGVSARLGTQTVFLGRRAWIEQATGWTAGAEMGAARPGCSEVWLWSEDLSGRILLRDDLRPSAAGVVRDLGALGLRVVVLTGDRPQAAESLRQHAGVQEVCAGLDPAAKVAMIRQLAEQGGPVAMIGDGVNDAPSLAAAEVGVAMGARGADAALEQAGVVLMNDRLELFLVAYRLSQRARRIIRQNLAVSLGTVLVLVAFALAGGIPLTVGVLGHEGSTVLVVLNSLRLLVVRRS
jgi:Cd2+/Zn2+-exporting ATPase